MIWRTWRIEPEQGEAASDRAQSEEGGREEEAAEVAHDATVRR